MHKNPLQPFADKRFQLSKDKQNQNQNQNRERAMTHTTTPRRSLLTRSAAPLLALACGLAAGTAPLRRPSAALLNLKTMSQPVRHLTDWALATVASDNIGRRTPEGQTAMPLETLLRADPEVLVVWSRKDLEQVSTDPRFAHLSAVRNKRVHAVPVGAAPWLTPSAEYCLGILWLAQRTHPERFADLDLVGETREFYRRFYSMPIDAREAAAILAGMD